MTNPGPFQSEQERRAAWVEHRKAIIAARRAHHEKIMADGLSVVVPPELPFDPPGNWGQAPDGTAVETTMPNPLVGQPSETVPADQIAAALGHDGEVRVPGEVIARALGQQAPPRPAEPSTSLGKIDSALGRWSRKVRS